MLEGGSYAVASEICNFMGQPPPCVPPLGFAIVLLVMLILVVTSVVSGVLAAWVAGELFADWLSLIQPFLRVQFSRGWPADQFLYVATCLLGLALGVIGERNSTLIFMAVFPALVIAPVATWRLGIFLRMAWSLVLLGAYLAQITAHVPGLAVYTAFFVLATEFQGYRWVSGQRAAEKYL